MNTNPPHRGPVSYYDDRPDDYDQRGGFARTAPVSGQPPRQDCMEQKPFASSDKFTKSPNQYTGNGFDATYERRGTTKDPLALSFTKRRTLCMTNGFRAAPNFERSSIDPTMKVTRKGNDVLVTVPKHKRCPTSMPRLETSTYKANYIVFPTYKMLDKPLTTYSMNAARNRLPQNFEKDIYRNKSNVTGNAKYHPLKGSGSPTTDCGCDQGSKKRAQSTSVASGRTKGWKRENRTSTMFLGADPNCCLNAKTVDPLLAQTLGSKFYSTTYSKNFQPKGYAVGESLPGIESYHARWRHRQSTE